MGFPPTRRALRWDDSPLHEPHRDLVAAQLELLARHPRAPSRWRALPRTRLLFADHRVHVLQDALCRFLAYRLETVREDGVVALLQEVPQHRVLLGNIPIQDAVEGSRPQEGCRGLKANSP